MTTLGSQSKLKEGHYVHHFSINPLNLRDHSEIANKGKKESETVFLSNLDIEKLKEGMKKGATYYDSASKAGTENELLLWIQLKKESKAVLPNLSELVEVERKESGQVKIDLSKIKEVLESRKDEIEKIEVSYNSSITELIGLPDNSVISEL